MHAPPKRGAANLAAAQEVILNLRLFDTVWRLKMWFETMLRAVGRQTAANDQQQQQKKPQNKAKKLTGVASSF